MNLPTKALIAAAATIIAATTVVGVTAAVNNDAAGSAPISLAQFPTPQSTGVPAGTILTAYSGPTTITKCGAVLDGVVVTGDLDIRVGNGSHSASTPCVTIKNSRVKGIVDLQWTSKGYGPLLMTDSEVANPTPRDVAAVSQSNVFMWRTYVHGARSGVQCDGFCELHDNYLLADHEFGAAHMDAFITNGNYGSPMLLDHNSFLCKPAVDSAPVPGGAGCAADVGLFGDFSAITNTTVTNNVFRATTAAYYCIHTPYEPGKPFPNGGNDTITGNVFEKGSSGHCGNANAVYNWNNVAGKWCNNLFDDGTAVLPGNPDNCGSTPPTTVTTTTVVPPTTRVTIVSTVPPPTTTTTTRGPTTSTSSTSTSTVPGNFSVGPISCTIDGRTHAVLHCP